MRFVFLFSVVAENSFRKEPYKYICSRKHHNVIILFNNVCSHRIEYNRERPANQLLPRKITKELMVLTCTLCETHIQEQLI